MKNKRFYTDEELADIYNQANNHDYKKFYRLTQATLFAAMRAMAVISKPINGVFKHKMIWSDIDD